ncbi:patatin-like phospholipase family protein [Planosporangium sp. 12N6]|uniref:patatin-like phospholipase family protein n=1 Tax=Planosporangium spinosum TaxID=3402278 RepID=UPI003CF6F4BD
MGRRIASPERPRVDSTPRIDGGTALVFAGTGAPAAYFGAGAVQALEEAGQRPRVVSGVSTGAINAYALGAGLDASALARMWSRIGWSDLYRPRADLWRAVNVGRLLRPNTNPAEYLLDAVGWTWLLDPAPTRRTLTRYLGPLPITPPPDLVVVLPAVDEVTGRVVRFCSRLPPRRRRDPWFRQVDLTADHVLASAAMPLLMRPSADDRHPLVDAGLVAGRPLAPVMRYEPDRVVVVSGAAATRAAGHSLGAAIALLADAVTRSAVAADLDHAHTVNRLVRAAPAATVKRYVPVLLVEPADVDAPAGGLLTFTAAHARRMIEYGRERAAAALAAWQP